jgi:hypothetical protein
MGKAESKREFITQLFLYYKPLLTNQKQTQLLLSWLESCVEKQEYEMADELKKMLVKVDDGEFDNDTNEIGLISINEGVELSYEYGSLPKIVPKNVTPVVDVVETPKRCWRYTNKWLESSYGFTLIDLDFSIKNKTFSLIMLNHCISYGLKINNIKDER